MDAGINSTGLSKITVIENRGAATPDGTKLRDTCIKPSTNASLAPGLNTVSSRKFVKTIKILYCKFKRLELSEQDFKDCVHDFESDENGMISCEGRNKSMVQELDLDEIVPVDFELDFEGGKVELKRSKERWCTVCKERKENEKEKKKTLHETTKNEQDMKTQMTKLMTTFEKEKKNLAQKLENEKQAISKQLIEKYEERFSAEKDFLGAVIADLVRSLEEAKDEAEQERHLRNKDRISLQKQYHKKLAEEKKKMQLGVKHG